MFNESKLFIYISKIMTFEQALSQDKKVCPQELDSYSNGTEKLLFKGVRVPSTMYDGCHPYRDREI